MNREQVRITRKLEKNPGEECNKILKRFYPALLGKFQKVADTRHKSYITYSSKEMLGTLFYKGIAGISSMQQMTREFNDENVSRNLYHFLDAEQKEFLPHGVTLNEFLEKLNPEELEEIQKDIAYQMIRRKTFDDAKSEGRWLVLVDGTELDEGYQKKNAYYLSRTYHRGEENEFVKYHRSMLEAKLYLGNNLVCSIASEAIENSKEYCRKQMSEEKIKQDCESKAFKRLAEKLKKKFPRLPICIVADGLYVSTPVLNVCEGNEWDYLIRYREGCAPLIEEDYQRIPEKNQVENAEYINGVQFVDREVNAIKYKETKQKGKEKVTTTFGWITSIKITNKNALKLVRAGRNRWKIENQGFNRQKRWQGDIEHACSFHETAQKNHYLMEQISDFIKQLYEYFFLKKNEIKKTQKNISSELLASFGRQLTGEDISSGDMQSISAT